LTGDDGIAPAFYATPDAWRAWLEAHHGDAREHWVGFHKRDSGRESITWPEAVDQALCFGWIDGIRRRIDDASYMIRFTPRRRTSRWSMVNARRVGELREAGLMRPAGRIRPSVVSALTRSMLIALQTLRGLRGVKRIM